MSDPTSLDSILNEEKKPAEAPAAPPAAEAPLAEKVDHSADYKGTRQKALAKEYAAQGRDPETGQFLPKEEPKEPVPAAKPEPKEAAPAAPPAAPTAPPVQQLTEKERAFLTAAQQERAKRLEVEKRLAELEKKPAEPPKQFWDDPEGALAKHQEEMRAIALETRLRTAETIARTKYPDFDEKIAVFTEVIANTPGLHQQWLAAPDPAEFAYKTGKNYKDLRDAGNLDTLRANIEKEARLKVEAEFKAKQEELEKARAALPPSLSDARGTTVNRPVWGGPTALEEILKH